jgi:uncharacterized protein (TIGR00288 family)
MNSRNQRTPSRAQSALIHRGPQAMAASSYAMPAPLHAPNAALLIDFDNVTMGIRSDLGKELRSLLSSEIIRGKVAVQRAYADWRRYPQYIVPLSEASIDLIFAPAYGSSKKNATDIRLAIDALELVFTRPEIGTFILLSGDSDFSSLVIKLKEYGKYVIGVGIRESSSDLLVQNCDEYYSYNALAGLVKASEDEPARKYDPWELVTEAVQRMKRNNDVMRSDRLKQVMQDIDSSFDEKNLGISKFSRFCQEAAQKGLLAVTKLENGQLEVDVPSGAPTVRAEAVSPVAEVGEAPAAERSRRGRRGRGGRGRDREGREPRPSGETLAAREVETPASLVDAQLELAAPSAPVPLPVAESAPEVERPISPDGRIGVAGDRLTRAEAFELVRRAVNELVSDDEAVRASVVRRRSFELLGRDSESLNERMFVRILKDAHDDGIIDLRRRGDDFEVARAVTAAPVSEQLARSEEAAVALTPAAAPAAPGPRRGMGHRGAGARMRGRPGAPPPELLSIGVVESAPTAPPAVTTAAKPPASENGAAEAASPPPAKRGRARAKKVAAVANVAAETADAAPEAAEPAPAKARRARPGAKAGAKRPRAAKGSADTKK